MNTSFLQSLKSYLVNMAKFLGFSVLALPLTAAVGFVAGLTVGVIWFCARFGFNLVG